MISVQTEQHSSRSSRKFLLSRSGKSEVARLGVCQLLDKRLQPRERIPSIISDANETRERERRRRRERESEEEKTEKKENNRRRLNVAEVLGGETRIRTHKRGMRERQR